MLDEEKKNENTTLGDSAFARVLARLMEERDIPADHEHALELAEKAGLGVEAFRTRLAGESVYLPDLADLAKELDLSSLEMRFLALAYAFEEDGDPVHGDPRAGWTQWEREEFDAHAEAEAWEYAGKVLEPLVQATRQIGSDELDKVMDKALAEVRAQAGGARAALEDILREQDS
jgi:hypothetical protein